MRITGLETFCLGYQMPYPLTYARGEYQSREAVLVKVHTDDPEFFGWGEAAMWGGPWATTATVLEKEIQPLIVGHDPHRPEYLWEKVYQETYYHGRKGILLSCLSAIDIALWDLKGKALGRSVLDLLGGCVHERLPAIASCHAHYESIEEMAEETAEWVSTGLQGLKTGFGKRGNANLGYDHKRDVAYVKAMREVLGDKMLMIDNGINIKWDVTDAVRRARAMEEYNLAWIEEPLGAWDPEGYANLRSKTTTRIAYGEREWTLEQFERVLATGTVDVVGVDPGRAEGITGFKKVTERCEFYRRQANAHAWSSAIVTAASLAISFNSPACKLFEFKPLRNPMQHDLVTRPFEHVDGWVYPPTGPGLGIEVIEEVVESFRSEKVLGKL